MTTYCTCEKPLEKCTPKSGLPDKCGLCHTCGLPVSSSETVPTPGWRERWEDQFGDILGTRIHAPIRAQMEAFIAEEIEKYEYCETCGLTGDEQIARDNKLREEATTAFKGKCVQKIEGLGEQQADNTVWVNMDEAIAAIKAINP